MINILPITHIHRYIFKRKKFSNFADLSVGRPEGSLFNSFYSEVYGEGATPFPGSLYLPLICTL